MCDTSALHTRIAQLEQEIAELENDSNYGCLTRQGLERRTHSLEPSYTVVVFGDVNGMADRGWRKGANSRYGYEGVNQRIASALQETRTRSGEFNPVIARYMSGDELVWIIPLCDVSGFIERINSAFHTQGLSITLGTAVIENGELTTAINNAASVVQHTKARRKSNVLKKILFVAGISK